MEQKKIKNLLIKILINKGKKTLSEKIYKNLLIYLKNKFKTSPDKILKNSIINKLSPKLNVKTVKKKTFVIPLVKEKQIKISLKWLLTASKNKTVTLPKLLKNLTNEFYEIENNKGFCISKKHEIYENLKKVRIKKNK
jgi:ribosomal protein S7